MRSLPSIIILAISIGLIATPLTASAQVMVTTPGTSKFQFAGELCAIYSHPSKIYPNRL